MIANESTHIKSISAGIRPFGQPRFAYDKVSPSKKSIPLAAARMASPLPRRRINIYGYICEQSDKSEFITLLTKNRRFCRIRSLATLAQLVEQQTENLRVWSSILRGGKFVFCKLKNRKVQVPYSINSELTQPSMPSYSTGVQPFEISPITLRTSPL